MVRRDDGWAVLGEGDSKDTIHTLTQREAVERARAIAQKQGAEVFVHGEDGKIRASMSYGDKITEEYYLADRIVVSPNIVHGKPRVKGTRIMVALILDLLAAGKTIEEIISDDYYPDLNREDVLACIGYASLIANEPYVLKNSSEISLERVTPEYSIQ